MGNKIMSTEQPIQRLTYQDTVKEAHRNLATYLAEQTGLPKGRIKDAMNKGAVQLKRGKQTKRVRRAETAIQANDQISFHYDAHLLSLNPPMPSCVEDRMGYSIWFKPAGVMSQGTDFGDHMSMLRIAEKQLGNKREVFLVHRLDRETRGLMIIAHNKKMAALLSELFQKNEIKKGYRAIVLGEPQADVTVSTPLDGRSAITHLRNVKFDGQRNTSEVDIDLETGRTHQIRRHLDSIGHPIMGDPKYGQNNKNREGLQLIAYRLNFQCPIRKDLVDIALPEPFKSKDNG
jgi:tRNA pseudouridine32 synthase/23S rRNA pseudouridine746 synthase